MTAKINPWQIVTDHFATLRDFQTGQRQASDIALFFGVPAVLAAVSVIFHSNLKADVVNGILTAASIFVGLLLSLLMLVLSFAQRKQEEVPSSARRDLLKEVHANISFSVLVSLAIVVIALLALAFLKAFENEGQTRSTHPVFTFLLVYLGTNFVLTILMVLKRMHNLMVVELDSSRPCSSRTERTPYSLTR